LAWVDFVPIPLNGLMGFVLIIVSGRVEKRVPAVMTVAEDSPYMRKALIDNALISARDLASHLWPGIVEDVPTGTNLVQEDQSNE
jgi:hypothetical protein